MKKKLIALLMTVAVSATVFAGCGTENKADENTTEATTNVTTTLITLNTKKV